MTQLDNSDSFADREYEQQLRRHLLTEEKNRRVFAGEDTSVSALQEWALVHLYSTGSMGE